MNLPSRQRMIILISAVLLVGCITLIAGILLSQSKQTISPLRILSVRPTADEKRAGLFPEIAVSFSRDLTPDEQKQVTLEAIPPVSGQVFWPSANKVQLEQTSPLKQGQEYRLVVSYPRDTYSWVFTTLPTENTSFDDQVRIQTKADKTYADGMKARDDIYPWASSLPLQTQSYYVFFDFTSKSLKGYVFQSKTSSVENTKAEAIQKLQENKIPIDSYPITWQLR